MPDIFVAKNEATQAADGAKMQKSRSVKEYSTVMAEEKPTRNPLASFVVRPKRIRFETQEKKEDILLLLRSHFVTNVPWIVMAIIGFLLPIGVAQLPGWKMILPRFQTVGVIAWCLLVVGYVWESFLNWYFNVFIVTDERIIDVDFYSLIYKKVSAAKIENIEDVTFTQSGVAQAFFDFGTVYIQTAGERREFDFTNVSQPRKVALFLNEMYLEEERERIEGRVR